MVKINSVKDKLTNFNETKNLPYISLIVIMAVLLIQSAISLFAEPAVNTEIEQLDIIFRTALSSIFGYIMSMAVNDKVNGATTETITSTATRSIGFTATDDIGARYADELQVSENEIELGEASVKTVNEGDKVSKNTHIFIITAICVFCLVMTILARNFSTSLAASSSTSSTLAQYRDFISGSIGALIGLSRANNS